MKTCDVLIKHAHILCMDEGYTTYQDANIAIENGKIMDIYPSEQQRYIGDKEIDATECIVLPGFINAHSHIPMTYFRGLADDLPLAKWLQEYIWPLEAKMINASFVYDASLHGAAEMIKNGITLTNDMYFYNDSIAKACSKAGLRVIVSEAIIDLRLNGDFSQIGHSLRELSQIHLDNPLVDISLAPHAIYTCSTQTLERCVQLASDEGWLLHTHISESRQEVENCLSEHGLRPLEYLDKVGFLQLPSVLAHGIWLNETEIEILAKSKSSIAICTDSNLKLASGLAPLKTMMDSGVNLCLGTDGVASNNNLDILEELGTTAKLHKAIANDPEFLPAREALTLVTRQAAKAIGKSDTLGSLEIGKDADILVIDTSYLQSQPLYNPYSQILYAIGAEQIRDVLIAGKVVMQDRELQFVDEAEILSRAKEYKHKILSEIQDL